MNTYCYDPFGVILDDPISCGTGSLAFDASSSSTVTTGTHSHSHTTAGSDRLLLVALYYQSGISVTSVKYAGVDLTAVGAAATNSLGQSVRMYSLVAPASGANTVAVVFGGSFPSETHVVASSYTGVHQTTPLGTQATATGTASVNVSATAGQDLVVDAVLDVSGYTFTAGADQGKLRESLGTVFSGAMSAEHARGSSVTMNWGQGSAIVGVALKPATTAPPGTSETVAQPFRWAGVLYDGETGLCFTAPWDA